MPRPKPDVTNEYTRVFNAVRNLNNSTQLRSENEDVADCVSLALESLKDGIGLIFDIPSLVGGGDDEVKAEDKTKGKTAAAEATAEVVA